MLLSAGFAGATILAMQVTNFVSTGYKLSCHPELDPDPKLYEHFSIAKSLSCCQHIHIYQISWIAVELQASFLREAQRPVRSNSCLIPYPTQCEITPSSGVLELIQMPHALFLGGLKTSPV